MFWDLKLKIWAVKFEHTSQQGGCHLLYNYTKNLCKSPSQQRDGCHLLYKYTTNFAQILKSLLHRPTPTQARDRCSSESLELIQNSVFLMMLGLNRSMNGNEELLKLIIIFLLMLGTDEIHPKIYPNPQLPFASPNSDPSTRLATIRIT
jgi:hypothetical protein